MRGNHTLMFVSLTFSLASPLPKNKERKEEIFFKSHLTIVPYAFPRPEAKLVRVRCSDLIFFSSVQPVFFFKKYFLYLFFELRGRKEKERETNINVWLPLVRPLLGTWPATQACALTLGIEPVTLWFSGWHSIH